MKNFGAFLDDYVAKNTIRPGIGCAVCSLPPDILEAIRDKRSAENTAWSVLTRALGHAGHKLAKESLSRHFRDHEQR